MARLDFNRKYRNENVRRYMLSSDWGWVFSHRLMERLVRKTGMSASDVESLLISIGTEMADLLTSGYPIGLPKCPVLYFKRVAPVRLYGGKRICHDVFRLCKHTPKYLKTDMKARGITRGCIREQLQRERLRVTGCTNQVCRVRKPRKNVRR